MEKTQLCNRRGFIRNMSLAGLASVVGEGKAAPTASAAGTVRFCAFADIHYPQAKVSPGEMYAVELSVKDGAPYPVMRFRKNHDWMRGLEDISVIFGEPDANGWRHGIGMVEIPEDADEFWLLVHSRFRNDDNVLKVDDVHVYRLW